VTQGIFYDMLLKKEERYMRKVSLFFPIFYTQAAIWWTYRFFSNLSAIYKQSYWITFGDIFSLILVFALAIGYWIRYIKGKKDCEDKDK
jgi:hypothetical protein